MNMRTIDVNRLLSFCDTYTIGQGVTGRLLVTVGTTKRGDDIYKDLLEFEEIYMPRPEGTESSQDDLISRDALKAYARTVICGNNPTNTLIIRMFDEIIDNAPAEVD